MSQAGESALLDDRPPLIWPLSLTYCTLGAASPISWFSEFLRQPCCLFCCHGSVCWVIVSELGSSCAPLSQTFLFHLTTLTGLDFIIAHKLPEPFTLLFWPLTQMLMSQESKSKTVASKQEGSRFISSALISAHSSKTCARIPGDLSWVYPSSRPEHWRTEGNAAVNTKPSGICWQILHKLPIYLLSGWRCSGGIWHRTHHVTGTKTPSKLTWSQIFPLRERDSGERWPGPASDVSSDTLAEGRLLSGIHPQ